MRRLAILVALAAFVLAAPAYAGKNVPIIVSMQTASADRTWVTVYRGEIAGWKREIVASGWISPRSGLVTHQYDGYHYFVRGQVHRGAEIVADTTVEVDPVRDRSIALVGASGGFHWQVYR